MHQEPNLRVLSPKAQFRGDPVPIGKARALGRQILMTLAARAAPNNEKTHCSLCSEKSECHIKFLSAKFGFTPPPQEKGPK